ncbi:cytochrome c oxidase subunit 1, partial [Nowakowskiella sp. JEL0078]
PVENERLYEQASESILKGCFPISAKIATKLAAIRAQVLFGDSETTIVKQRISPTIQEWIPQNLVKNYPVESWVSGIISEYQSLIGTERIEGKMNYLDIVRSLRYYGSGMFPAKYLGFWKHAENIVLTVSSSAAEGADESEEITYTFKTQHGEEIVQLIREYSPMKKKQDNKQESSDSDLAWYRRDLMKAQINLQKQSLVQFNKATQPPVKKSSSLNLISSAPLSISTILLNNPTQPTPVNISETPTNTECGSKSSQDLRGPVENENISLERQLGETKNTDKSFASLFESCASGLDKCEKDWEYSSVKLLILSRSESPKNSNESPRLSIVQSYLGKCIENTCMADELYLQLIKQTNGFPEPDG